MTAAAQPCRPGCDLQVHPGGDGGIVLGLGDFPLLQHIAQDLVAALQRVLRVHGGVVEAGAVHQPGQQRRLRQREVLGGGAEEVPRGGLDAVGVPVEEHDVQVALEDLVLGELLFQLDGELHFPQLVAHGLLAAEDDLLALIRGKMRLIDDVGDVLLGERGRTLTAALGDIERQCPEDPLRVEAAMLVEAAVLDRDDRVLDKRRHLVEGDPHPVLGVERGDGLTVCGHHFGGLRRRIDREVTGQAVEERNRIADRHPGGRHAGGHQAGGQDPTDGAHGNKSDQPSQGCGQTRTQSLLRCHLYPAIKRASASRIRPTVPASQSPTAVPSRARGPECLTLSGPRMLSAPRPGNGRLRQTLAAMSAATAGTRLSKIVAPTSCSAWLSMPRSMPFRSRMTSTAPVEIRATISR